MELYQTIQSWFNKPQGRALQDGTVADPVDDAAAGIEEEDLSTIDTGPLFEASYPTPIMTLQ